MLCSQPNGGDSLIEAPRDVGQQLRSLRESRGISVRGLAEILGVSTVTIWKWEKGATVPRAGKLKGIIDALKEAPDDQTRPNEARRVPLEDRSEAPEAMVRDGRTLAEVVLEAKRIIAAAARTDPNQVTVVIEY